MKPLKIVFASLVGIFALIGVVLVGGFFAVKYHFTDDPGVVDEQSRYLAAAHAEAAAAAPVVPAPASATIGDPLAQVAAGLLERCKLMIIARYAPEAAARITAAATGQTSDTLLANMVAAASLPLASNASFAQDLDACSAVPKAEQTASAAAASEPFAWIHTDEWRTFSAAVVKDKAAIDRAAAAAGLEPRLLMVQLAAEQMRLYHSERETYKKFLAPLQILGSEVKFSLGVMGIKEATAQGVERHLLDPASVFYPGPAYQHLLDFSAADRNAERYRRLTDDRDHYYSYLYAALLVKELEQQWQAAGYDISSRPEIIGTLFNVGFDHSRPKADPSVGGASIALGDASYSFGLLAYQVYYSGELLAEFPYAAAAARQPSCRELIFSAWQSWDPRAALAMPAQPCKLQP